MPHRKTICPCRICGSNANPIDTRISAQHISKYGIDESSNSPQKFLADKQPDTVLYFSSFETCGEQSPGSANSTTVLSSDDSDQETSRPSQDLMEEHATVYSSSSEDEEEMDTHETSSDWSSFTHDQSLYSRGIAMEKVPNSSVSVLQWLAMNFYLFTSHPSMSKAAFTNNLKMQSILTLDVENEVLELPKSYRDARKMIDPYVVKKKIILFCVNDCVAFRCSYADLEKCPFCFSSEKKRFVYLPIGPRISRIFGEENLAKLIQSHPGSDGPADAYTMWDIHDSPLWMKLYSPNGYFGGDKNGLSFALELDGVNPFHNIGVVYSMTPVMLTLLNLPRNTRNLFGNILLVGIIPGKRKGSEVSNVSPYVEILVDELLYLTQCKVVDQYRKAPVEVKLKLLLYVLDYPGLSKLFNQHGSGALSGCHWCLIRGKYCKHLSKVIYLSKPETPEDRQNKCESSEVRVSTHDQISFPAETRSQDSEIQFREAYAQAKNKTNADLVASATGCKDTYPLLKLPGHNRIEESIPDACHTVKDVVQNIMNFITNKNVNMKKIIEAETTLGRLDLEIVSTDPDNLRRLHLETHSSESSASVLKAFADNHDGSCSNSKKPRTSGKDKAKPEKTFPLPYVMTQDEIKLADRRANSLRVPQGFGLKPSPFVGKSGCLKSHDWKQIACNGILKYCLRDCLSKQCRITLFNLLDSISDVCSESQSADKLDKLEKELNNALDSLEQNFPLHLQNITTHILRHIVAGIKLYGPVYGTWMFVFERFNSWICKRAKNMRYPEATVMETYLIFDWCQFMISSGRMPQEFHTVFPEEEDSYEEETLPLDELLNQKKALPITCKESQYVHVICKKCPKTHCKIFKYKFHEETKPETGRVTRYSCLKKTVGRTDSSFVYYKATRGCQTEKVSPGHYIKFGQILYFVEHINSFTGEKTCLAYIETFYDAKLDSESKLWFCQADCLKKKNFIKVEALSNPLVIAEENGKMWFISSEIKL